ALNGGFPRPAATMRFGAKNRPPLRRIANLPHDPPLYAIRPRLQKAAACNTLGMLNREFACAARPAASIASAASNRCASFAVTRQHMETAANEPSDTVELRRLQLPQ